MASPISRLSPTFVVDSIGIRSSSMKDYPLQVHSNHQKRSKDENKIDMFYGFNKKVDGTPNVTHPLVVTLVIPNHKI